MNSKFNNFKEEYLKIDVYNLTIMAVCIALEIICSRFLSIQTPVTRLSFSFIALAIAGMLLGPVRAGVVGFAADILGLFLFSGYTFNPGITLTTTLVGVLFGICLYKKPAIIRCVIAAAIHQLFLSFVLNTLWLAMMYQTPYLEMMYTRILQTTIMLPVEMATLILICNKQTYRAFKLALNKIA